MYKELKLMKNKFTKVNMLDIVLPFIVCSQYTEEDVHREVGVQSICTRDVLHFARGRVIRITNSLMYPTCLGIEICNMVERELWFKDIKTTTNKLGISYRFEQCSMFSPVYKTVRKHVPFIYKLR